jgi:hypothetical protein
VTIVKRAIIMLWVIDNAVMQALRKIFPTAWQRSGRCLCCGRCCKEIYLSMTPGQARSRLFVGFFRRWFAWLFAFEFIRFDREAPALVFRCLKQRADGRCGNYFWRPPLCRNYPLLDYFKKPCFLPGCGFTSSRKT